MDEVLLLCCSVLSLITSCILWSPHKQVWMDEIFTWKEVSDPSLWHLYYAIQHGADGGQPLFYTTAWIWAKAFGTSVIALRLYSSCALCAALVITWRTIRRFYGLWATAVGILIFWGTSGTLLDQNVEARFYGLYMLTVAITFAFYVRLITRKEITRFVLLAAFCSQAALVLTHVLGLIYSGLILAAIVLVDYAKGNIRFKLYLVYVAGWLTLLIWIPAIQMSMAAGRPHGWIALPDLTDLRTSYLFADSLPWLRFLKRHSFEFGFQVVKRATELVFYAPLVLVFLAWTRRICKSGWRSIADPKVSVVLFGYVLLCVPVVLFVLSHLITPVFVPRYFLPSGIGMAIIFAATAEALGSDRPAHAGTVQRVIWAAVLLFLLSSPVLTVLAVGPVNLSWDYLDLNRLEREAPENLPMVAGWQEDFVKAMRLSHDAKVHYYFLLDWPGALVGPRAFVLDYHLMQAYRNNGYYENNIQDSRRFLCSHSDFLVLDGPNANTLDRAKGDSPDFDKPKWFDTNIRTMPQFQWNVIDTFDGPEVYRKLIVVHRKARLTFCSEP